MIGGIGAGAGHDLVGISIGGIAVGAGNLLKGIHVAGIAVGAPIVRGLVVSGIAAGGQDVRAAVVSPLYFKIDEGGYFRGVSIAAYNHIKGEQNGLTIGIFNWTRHLNGVQIGLLNYAGNQRKGLRWLPFVNFHHD